MLKNILFTTLLFLLTGALTSCFSQERAVLKKPVLVVNGHEVTTEEYSERLARRLKHYDALQAKDDATLTRAKEETIQAFILEQIAKDFAEKEKVSVDGVEVDAKVQEIRSRYPDDFAFRRALANENIPFDDWKEELEFTLLQKKIFSKISEKAPQPSDSEMKEFYEANKLQFQQPARVRLRQIVLEKEDDAKRISDELSKGADLAKLAKQFSVAPESANGGDTGWLDKGTLEVFDQAFKMKEGQRSKILKSPYGYHIYEVLKKEPEARLSFEQAKAKIRAQLLEKREQAAFSKWLEEQVRSSKVQRNDAVIQSIQVTTRGS